MGWQGTNLARKRSVKCSLQGSKKIKELMKKAEKNAIRAAMGEMKKAAIEAENIAKANAAESADNAWERNMSVKTGSIAPCPYHESIEAFSFKGREAYGIKGHYWGWFLEFGTKFGIEARPHIRPAVRAVRKKMCKAMLAALTRVTAKGK